MHLIEETGLLNRGIFAFLTLRLIVTNQTVRGVQLQRTHWGPKGLHNKVEMKVKAESNSPKTALNAGLSVTTTRLSEASGPGRLL